jgi:hypothetical protein
MWSAWRGDVEPIPGRLFWTRYLAGYAILTTAIFSALPYKTPWNILPFYAGVLVVAGIGFSWLVRATPSRLARAAVTCAVAIASLQLGWQAWPSEGGRVRDCGSLMWRSTSMTSAVVAS